MGPAFQFFVFVFFLQLVNRQISCVSAEPRPPFQPMTVGCKFLLNLIDPPDEGNVLHIISL